ncbi:hypothetical protein K1719_036847 [Acacia pycnantha]|nr:hypothetical protein K1719_036847 [Acacia pycnantha]
MRFSQRKILARTQETGDSDFGREEEEQEIGGGKCQNESLGAEIENESAITVKLRAKFGVEGSSSRFVRSGDLDIHFW